jgi:hypothetical protein
VVRATAFLELSILAVVQVQALIQALEGCLQVVLVLLLSNTQALLVLLLAQG